LAAGERRCPAGGMTRCGRPLNCSRRIRSLGANEKTSNSLTSARGGSNISRGGLSFMRCTGKSRALPCPFRSDELDPPRNAELNACPQTWRRPWPVWVIFHCCCSVPVNNQFVFIKAPEQSGAFLLAVSCSVAADVSRLKLSGWAHLAGVCEAVQRESCIQTLKQ